MQIRQPVFFFLFLCILTTAIGALAELFLPDRFFYDAYVIALDRHGEIGLRGSFPFSMWFYETTYLNRLPFAVIAIIQIPMLFFLIYKIGIPSTFNRFTLRNVLAWLSLLILAFYLGMPSKEFITFIFSAAVVGVLHSGKHYVNTLVWISLLFVFFGWWFRPYFVLIPILAIGLEFISRIKVYNRTALNIIGGLAIAVFLSLSYGVVSGEFMSQSTREALNETRVNDPDAETAITSPIPTDSWGGEAFGIVYGFFTVNLPVNALKFLGKPQVLAFIVWQLLLIGFIIYYYSRCLRSNYEWNRAILGFHLLISYMIIQGVFEPDLGSAIKHKMGVLPFIWICLYFDKLGVARRLR